MTVTEEEVAIEEEIVMETVTDEVAVAVVIGMYRIDPILSFIFNFNFLV